MWSILASASSTSSEDQLNKVDDAHYRNLNLANNHVYLRRHHHEVLPSNLLPLMDKVHAVRTSPPPDLAEYHVDLADLEYRKGKTDVEDYFKAHIFPKTKGDAFRTNKKMIYKHAPIPDFVYGYTHKAFTDSQQIQLGNIGREVRANAEDLFYPFFVIEMKADGPHRGRGGLYITTNQCLGGSSSYVKLANDLFFRLASCHNPEIRGYNNAAFSIAINSTEAHDYKYYMQRTNIYLLQEADHLL
ncbi:hypothetical protein GQ44DRAFT_743809 [Phaeosphaeriaceae sp. PMI808]|nr:hypothetical protein GQ44DRAFT_743809 [Phaeosphaeriaceae sp. PMI808]